VPIPMSGRIECAASPMSVTRLTVHRGSGRRSCTNVRDREPERWSWTTLVSTRARSLPRVQADAA
jgi:hypothetical protein